MDKKKLNNVPVKKCNEIPSNFDNLVTNTEYYLRSLSHDTSPPPEAYLFAYLKHFFRDIEDFSTFFFGLNEIIFSLHDEKN